MEQHSISPDKVRHIARLARIRLTEQEVELYSQQLSQVIDYNMSQLNQVDTTGVEPLSQTTGLVNVWRDQDQPQSSLDQGLALSQAKQQQDHQFVVPKVLGES